MKFITAATLLFCSMNCASEGIVFSDDFESSTAFIDFFKKDYSRYTHFERTLTGNRIEVYPGQSILFSTEQSGLIVSKASLEKERFDFREGQIVKMTARVFIPDNQSLKDVFLFDLECISCWPKDMPANQHMGIRLMLRDAPGYASVERGKIGYRKGPFDQRGTPQAFPRNEWVRLDWIVKLSPVESGYSSVYINGVRVISESGATLPNPALTFSMFKMVLTEPIHYDKFEFGLTANGYDNKTLLYIDDLSISLLDNIPE